MPTNPLPPPPPFTTAPSKRGPIKFVRSMDEILDPMKQSVPMGLPPQGIEPQAPAIPPPHFTTPPGMQPMDNPMYSIDELVEEPLTTRPIFPARFSTGAQVLSQTEMNPNDPAPLRKTYGEAMPGTTGVMEGFADIMDFINSPMGVGVTLGVGAAFGGGGHAATTIGRTAAKTGLPDGIIKGLLKMGFTTSGIHGLTQSVPEMKQAFESGNTQEGAKQLVHTLFNAGMVLPGATVTEAQLTPQMPTRFTELGKRILNDEAGYLSLEFIHNKRQVARQDYGGAIARYSIGTEKPLPTGTRANIVVRSEPTGAPGEEVGAAVNLATEAGIPPENINYYYERSPGNRIRLSQADFYRRFGEPRPRVPFSQPLPETSTEGVEGPEPTGPRTQRGPQDPMALPAGVSPLPRTASGRISTKIPTTVGKTVRSKVESAVPNLPRSNAPAKPEPVPWVAPEPLPEGTRLPSSAPQLPDTLAGMPIPKSTLNFPAPATPPAAPVEAPVPAPAPVPAQGAPGSVMEQMLAVWMENNRLQAEYNRMLGQWIMQLNQGKIPAGSAPPPPPAPVTAPPTTPAPVPTAPIPTAPVTPKAPTPTSAAPVDAALEAEIMDVINSNPTGELTAGEAQMAGRRGGKATGERPYKTVQERDAYYAQLALEKRTPKERQRSARRGPHIVEYTEIDANGNLVTKKIDISKVEADARVKMVPGTPTPPPRHVEPKSMEEFNDALVKAEAGEGPQVYVELKGIGKTKGSKGWVRSRILNDRNQPTNYYEFLPDTPGAELREVKLEDILFTGKQATHSMNIARHGVRTFDMGIVGTATRKPNLIRGQRVQFPDGKIGTIVEKTDYASIKEFAQKVRTRIKEAQESGNTELAEQLSTFHDLLYERMTNAIKTQLANRGEGEFASDVNDTIVDLAGKYKGKLTSKLVAMDSGPWVLAEPTEFTVVEEKAPTNKKASKKILPQTKAARKDVEKRLTEAGGNRAQPDVPIHERTAGQGITAEAIAKATGRKRRDPIIEYRGLSKEQLKSRIAASNKQGKELLSEADAKEATLPQEATALRQKARELSNEIKDMKKALEVAPTKEELAIQESRRKEAEAAARSKKATTAIESPEAPRIPPPPGSRMTAEEYRARETKKSSPEEARKAIEALRKKKE